MKIKYTLKYLGLLENIFSQSGYTLRYEKGNFKSGYCILNTQKIVVVNKYYTTEGKINCLIDIIRTINWEFTNLDEKEQKLYLEILQSDPKA
ncbi:MAG: hypothetical protein NW226_12450 [Microscillaceae bacterium]|nr:hypothetical protein [Microscillaceae bacterium]